jgi:hypothetical protein
MPLTHVERHGRRRGCDVTTQNWVLRPSKNVGAVVRAVASGDQLVVGLGPGLGQASSAASNASLAIVGKDGVTANSTSPVLHPRVQSATDNSVNGTLRLTLARPITIKPRGNVRLRLGPPGSSEVFDLALASERNA